MFVVTQDDLSGLGTAEAEPLCAANPVGCAP